LVLLALSRIYAKQAAKCDGVSKHLIQLPPIKTYISYVRVKRLVRSSCAQRSRTNITSDQQHGAPMAQITRWRSKVWWGLNTHETEPLKGVQVCYITYLLPNRRNIVHICPAVFEKGSSTYEHPPW